MNICMVAGHNTQCEGKEKLQACVVFCATKKLVGISQE